MAELHGRHVQALDLAERLIPDLSLNEALLWPPDLFAYTSYALTFTAAYQLVVSPPSGKRWQPPKDELASWLYEDAEANLNSWFADAKNEWEVHDMTFDFGPHLEALDQWMNGTGAYDKQHFGDMFAEEKPRDAREASRTLDDWEHLARLSGVQWRNNLRQLDESVMKHLLFRKSHPGDDGPPKQGQRMLLETILENTPPLLLACWAFFHVQSTKKRFYEKNGVLRLSDLLCNQDDLQAQTGYCGRLWKVAQSLLTLHAISDLASLKFGIEANPGDNRALAFAEKLLFGKIQRSGGSLSTFNTERCRVLPKRHNPDIGITLRSISSNLAFHQSPVDVVWRKTQNNTLGEKLARHQEDARLSILLLPFPLSINAKHFAEDHTQQSGRVVNMPPDEYKFFTYDPQLTKNDRHGNPAKPVTKQTTIDRMLDLVHDANYELADEFDIDMIILPEAALSLTEFDELQEGLMQRFGKIAPSIIIAGVRESRDELAQEMAFHGHTRSIEDFNFSRNAVYCQYFDKNDHNGNGAAGSYYDKGKRSVGTITPKYKQYKHHRWQLDRTQIRRYGLSSILSPDITWWESIKIPKRRVSFLNVGDRMTISHLICEDLARQDPIAELVRQVGPTLVVSILMDGPQLKNRWSARYATVLSDDPGSSVITLTSLGMVKRHISEYGAMSRVIALWNESGAGHSREIELAQGADAVLLTLRMDETPEKTADGRKEAVATSILRLNDVIQIYPKNSKRHDG
jgi:hypothetical protein